MKKSFVLGVVLSLSTLCFAGQKSFTIVLDKATTVGSLKLAPGEYKVKVDGSNAVFTNSKYKSVTTPVKVETTEKKFKETAVDTVNSNDGAAVTAIQVGGTTTKLDFSKQSVASN
jgi:hypothetical protein